MEEIPVTSVEEFGHLGLVAAIIKKFDIGKRIDKLIPKSSNNQKINHSDAILAMNYQGLGFGDGRLYFAKDFFANKPLEKLFGNNIFTAHFLRCATVYLSAAIQYNILGTSVIKNQ
jgi:transposase